MSRERRVAPVMVRLEPSLHELLLVVLDEGDDTAASYLRGLLIKDLQARGRLDVETTNRLIGAGR